MSSIEIERLTTRTTCKFSVIENEGLATVFRDHRHCGNRVGEATLQAPKGRDPRPHWKLLDFRRQRFMSHDQEVDGQGSWKASERSC